jgi:hypothetical protein
MDVLLSGKTKRGFYFRILYRFKIRGNLEAGFGL